MTLVAFTGTTSASVLNANFDDKTSTLTTNAKAGQKDQFINLLVFALGSATDLSARSMLFTPQDDLEVRIISVKATDATASRTITLTLEHSSGNVKFTGGASRTAAVVTIIGSATTRTSFISTSADRFCLLRGVTYRLSVASNTAGATTSVQVGVQLRSKRRVA